MKPQVEWDQQSQITLLGQILSFESQQIPQACIFARTQTPPWSRGTGYTDGNCQPGRGWSIDGGYIAHGNPVQMIIKTAVQTHPAVRGWRKGLMGHYKPNCWAPETGDSFWPQDFVLSKYPSRALMLLPRTLAFPTYSLKICKNPSGRPEFLGRTREGQSENLPNGISCIQLLKFALRWWVDNLHQ